MVLVLRQGFGGEHGLSSVEGLSRSAQDCDPKYCELDR